jgi:electron transfer flavoprotein beta subunit
VVLVKQVPDTHNLTGEVMTKDGTMNRGALPAIFNPEDLNALEMALEIKGRFGGTVTVITMGPPKAANILRESLFRGADKVVLLTDRKFAGADTLATSNVLRLAVQKVGQYDLVLAGRQAIDGDTAQVGPQTAEKLGIPQITYAEQIVDVSDGRITVQRALDHGSEIVRCTFPVLLTVVGSANTPRPANVRRQMERKLAAVPSEYAAIRTQWPEFESDEALNAYLVKHDQDPRVDGRGHRRHRGQHRPGRLPDPGSQDQLRGPREHGEQDHPRQRRRNQGDDRGAGPRIHRRVGHRCQSTTASGYSSSTRTARSPTSASS